MTELVNKYAVMRYIVDISVRPEGLCKGIPSFQLPHCAGFALVAGSGGYTGGDTHL